MIDSLPREITQLIAYSAVRRARSWMTKKGWKSGDSIYPVFGPGYAAIKTNSKYLIYQDKGTKPFLMLSLEGKTIPIKGPDGVHFVKVRGVGQPGFVTLPTGERVWRQQKWRHPGIKATNFMDNALRAAVKDNRREIQAYTRRLLGGR